MILDKRKEHLLKIDDRVVKVIVQTPKKYQNRIVKYGWVCSFGKVGLGIHQQGEKFYKIAKRRFGPNRFGYSCDCEDNFYRGRICKHISAFRLAEGTNVKK